MPETMDCAWNALMYSASDAIIRTFLYDLPLCPDDLWWRANRNKLETVVQTSLWNRRIWRHQFRTALPLAFSIALSLPFLSVVAAKRNNVFNVFILWSLGYNWLFIGVSAYLLGHTRVRSNLCGCVRDGEIHSYYESSHLQYIFSIHNLSRARLFRYGYVDSSDLDYFKTRMTVHFLLFLSTKTSSKFIRRSNKWTTTGVGNKI